MQGRLGWVRGNRLSVLWMLEIATFQLPVEPSACLFVSHVLAGLSSYPLLYANLGAEGCSYFWFCWTEPSLFALLR